MGHRHYMLIEKDDWSVCLYSQWGAYYIEEVLYIVKKIIDENDKIKKISDLEELINLSSPNKFIIMPDLKDDDFWKNTENIKLGLFLNNYIGGNSSVLDLNKKEYKIPFIKSIFKSFNKMTCKKEDNFKSLKKKSEEKNFNCSFLVDLNKLDEKSLINVFLNMSSDDYFIEDYKSLSPKNKENPIYLHICFLLNSAKLNSYILSLKDNVEKKEIINQLLKINVNEVNEKTGKSFSLSEEDKQILDFYSLNDCLNQAENKKNIKI